GDAFLMPYLAAKASELGVSLRLGRDPDHFAGVKPKSYFTYGKIVYKPGQYILRGRLHLDRGHFAFRESDFAGLAELSRLSTLTPQEQARLTPGTAFSAMQVNQAYHDGCLVVWKKKEPGPLQDVYTGRDTILKWTLVTCYDGSTLVPIKENGIAKIARISDVIDPHLPNEPGVARAPEDLRAVGLDDSMRIVERQ